MTAIIDRLALLTKTRRLEFSSHPGAASRSGWQGHGVGEVRTTRDGMIVRFFESGRFYPTGQARAVAFSNIYRWEIVDDRLRLFHERRGSEQAVWLFDLLPQAGSTTLVEQAAHLCGEDCYSARLVPHDHGFDLTWRIRGPHKDEILRYRYRHV